MPEDLKPDEGFVFRCPSCGEDVEVKNPKKTFVDCPGCGVTWNLEDLQGWFTLGDEE